MLVSAVSAFLVANSKRKSLTALNKTEIINKPKISVLLGSLMPNRGIKRAAVQAAKKSTSIVKAISLLLGLSFVLTVIRQLKAKNADKSARNIPISP